MTSNLFTKQVGTSSLKIFVVKCLSLLFCQIYLLTPGPIIIVSQNGICPIIVPNQCNLLRLMRAVAIQTVVCSLCEDARKKTNGIENELAVMTYLTMNVIEVMELMLFQLDSVMLSLQIQHPGAKSDLTLHCITSGYYAQMHFAKAALPFCSIASFTTEMAKFKKCFSTWKRPGEASPSNIFYS